MFYEDTSNYIDELNRECFAGFDDWRLPTIPELMSLLEPEPQSNGLLYINPIFDATQSWCWSADRLPDSGSPGSAWRVNFNYGYVRWSSLTADSYVRAVRSGQ